MNTLLSVFAAFAVCALAAPSPPPFWKKAENARWLVHNLNYGVLSTESSDLNGTAFGNPQSFADGAADKSTGSLYFYVSGMDASMQDIAKNPKCSFTLSLQMLDDFCTKEWAPLSGQIDPEDPRCTRLTLIGAMRDVTAEELPFAKSSLLSRHPAMKDWPVDHNWKVTTIDIEAIWLIDMFGGASHIKPEEYFAVQVPSDRKSGLRLPAPKMASAPPPYTDKTKTARWMAHNLTYGVLSTTSVEYAGVAFGNPQSFVDGDAAGDGHLLFYVSELDASMADVKANPAASFTLSEEFGAAYCSRAGVDPEDPRCGRLVFSGRVRDVAAARQAAAKQALFARHRGMKRWPSDHSWKAVTIDVERIWLIDFFGGASIIDVKEYYAAAPVAV